VRKPIKLSAVEAKVRFHLVWVAQGLGEEGNKGRVSYKEVYAVARPALAWSRARTRDVVGWITRIAAAELQNGRPPLNELVTPKNRSSPKQVWEGYGGIREYLFELSGIRPNYRSHEEAQRACWKYWANHSTGKTSQPESSDAQVEEGYKEDRTATFVKRNKKIIEQAKKRDKYSCRACGFFLKVSARHVIDCHHVIPMSHFSGRRVTGLKDLVCLCPTCHRIAHTRPYPLFVGEVVELGSQAKWKEKVPRKRAIRGRR
jgi:5-methylcytosine-specific restriction endonuclease McrA